MDFDPATSTDQPSAPKLLEPGTYQLTVREAEERVSSKGNPMIAIELEPDGHAGSIIREYLVATPAAMFKVRQFCEAADLVTQFERGRLTEQDCRGRKVRARITVEPGTDGYQDKNRVDEFLKAGGIPTNLDGGGGRSGGGGGGGFETSNQGSAHRPIAEEDIPF